MLRHVFLYRIKILMRSKEYLFWSLLFPVILGTLFNLALGNIQAEEQFSSIPVGVVVTEETLNTQVIKAALGSVSESLFEVSYVDEETAGRMLRENKLKGYFRLKENPQLVVLDNGVSETIMKSFLDICLQKASTAGQIMEASQGTVKPGEIFTVTQSEYMKLKDISKRSQNPIVLHFFTLLAMACMFGNTAGVNEVYNVQANQSSLAQRNIQGMMGKFRLLLSSMAASIVVQIGMNLILLAYLVLILKVDLGSRFILIVITGIVGSIMGISFGACIGCLVKGSEGLKTGIAMGTTMLGCFFSGMMSTGIKYTVQQKFPLGDKINPVSLLTDAYYSLYYYDSYTRYLGNILWLLLWCVGFIVIIFMVLRRQQYDSL